MVLELVLNIISDDAAYERLVANMPVTGSSASRLYAKQRRLRISVIIEKRH
ncbi:MAG TPA: hypothetical protein VGD50_01115 [Candidatus Baltobacteraceae bacterium]